MIDVTDSSSQGHLVSSRQVREWIARSGIPTLGAKVSEVNLAGIEELIARNGFVDEANAYITYGGELCVDISQRRPVLRLLTDGMNAYVTSRGYVFAAPARSSLYVPVVTGSFRLPFPASWTGFAKDCIEAEKRKIDERIAELEREKYPFYKRERDNDENIRALRRMRIKKGWFEREEAFAGRVRELRAKKEALRRRYRYEERLVGEGIARIEARQEAERAKQKSWRNPTKISANSLPLWSSWNRTISGARRWCRSWRRRRTAERSKWRWCRAAALIRCSSDASSGSRKNSTSCCASTATD